MLTKPHRRAKRAIPTDFPYLRNLIGVAILRRSASDLISFLNRAQIGQSDQILIYIIAYSNTYLKIVLTKRQSGLMRIVSRGKS